MPRPWNVDIRFAANTPAGAKEDLERRLAKNPYLARILEHEREPTELEKRVIFSAGIALTRLSERLGLPAVDVPPSRVHILSGSEPEFAERVDLPRRLAVSEFGHVYIPRSEDPVTFARHLTHEICHAGSRLSIRLAQGASPRHVDISHRQMGFAFRPEGIAEPYFNGLNEGVTELVAHRLRNAMAKEDLGLDRDQARVFARRVEYRPWVILVDALVRLVADTEHAASKRIRDDLLRDYFRGGHEFLRRLSKCRKGSVKLLRQAESSPADAIAVADALGLDQAKRDIVNTSPPDS